MELREVIRKALTGYLGHSITGNWEGCADAILTALDAAGLVVVPREPDKHDDGLGMLVAGKDAMFCLAEDPSLDDARRCYAAMIAASPFAKKKVG